MKSSRWRKRNDIILYSGLLVTVIITGLLRFLGLPNPQEIALMIFVFIIGLVITNQFKARYPNEMVRRVRLEFEAAVEGVQNTLKDKNIRYYRVDEEDAVSFKVLGLTVTLIPYEVEKLTYVGPGAAYTLATLEGLNKQNMGLAEMVAEALNKIENE
mgnify:CR=1 FL=1